MDEIEGVSNIELMLFGMLGMFFLALGVVLFFVVYQRRLIKQQKDHQQKEFEYQQKLLRANFLSQEKERNRIGKDLHDSVGAMLSTVKLYFRHINQAGTSEDFDELKEKALGLLDETMQSVRRVSHDLRPVVLERLGLVEAVNNLVAQVNDSGEIEVSFQHEGDHEIDPEYQLSWYRIIQELINNTIKHAEASKIDLNLKSTADRLTLTYADDGIGIRSKKNLKSGLGIQNIESRLNLMQGSAEIKPSTQGFEIYLTSHTKAHEHDKSSDSG